MTLYNFIKSINSYSIANQSVKEFNSGDVYDIMNSGVHTYPAIVLTINSVSSEGDNSRVRGVLFYIDRLLSDNSNKDFIQSFGISVLNAIMVESYNKDYLCYENRNYVPFTEKFGDLCAGVYCEFEVLIDGEAVCVEGDFVSKTLLIDKNGTYNPTGYDSVEVSVHSEDMLNYFTLYPSNYIYANYFDPTTEIVANVKFTGDEDFYFCSDEKGLIGLYYSAEENETYAWWDSDRIALHFHKSDWEKGYYKIQFKAGRLQIGYLTWTFDTKGSTTSFDPLYFGYYEEKASPMEIEYITISNQYGAAYDYRPKITEEKAELVEVISGKIADIRTVYEQDTKLVEDYYYVSKAIDLGVKILNTNYISEICIKGFRGGVNILTNLANGSNPVVYGMWQSSSLGISAANYSKDVYRTNVLSEVGKDIVLRLEGDKFTYGDTTVTIPKGDTLPKDNMVINRMSLGNFDIKYCKIWDENGKLVVDVNGYVDKTGIFTIHLLKDNVTGRVIDYYINGLQKTATTLEDTTEDMPVVFNLEETI